MMKKILTAIICKVQAPASVSKNPSGEAFNLLGQKVNADNAQGIVISEEKKLLAK